MTNVAYVKATSQNHTITPPKPTIDTNTLMLRRAKFGNLLHSSSHNDLFSPLLIHKNYTTTTSSSSSNNSSTTATTSNSSNNSSPTHDNNHDNSIIASMSPFNLQISSFSPTNDNYLQSPWRWVGSNTQSSLTLPNYSTNNNKEYGKKHTHYSQGSTSLIGSLMREDGHIHSLAVRSGVLYTGSESNNIRIWRHFQDAGSLKSGGGFVKAILVASPNPYHSRVFTGHNDGKIRVWTHDGKRVGTFPKLTDFIKTSVNPKKYVDPRKNRKVVPHITHSDAVSCLGLNEASGLLYSGSWDKTIKVWRVKDGKLLESINAHVDAINSIMVGFDGLVFSGSADGTLKVWRREVSPPEANTCTSRHVHVRTLLEQENAVTSLSVADDGVLYCGSSDGLVNFWERDNKKEVVYGGVLRGHKVAVLCLATAGCLVLSGSADKSICVWKREKGGGGVHSFLAVLHGHSGPVKCLAVERDRDHDDKEDDDEKDQRRSWVVYSGSLDKSVRIWRVSEHASMRHYEANDEVVCRSRVARGLCGP